MKSRPDRIVAQRVSAETDGRADSRTSRPGGLLAALERAFRRMKKTTPRPWTNTGRALTLEGLVFLCARRLLKVPLETLWPAITYVDFEKFIPDELNDFLLWHVDEGSLDSRQPARPQSWTKLLAAVRSQDYRRNLPSSLLDRPSFALLFALVFPHRLTSELMLFLDDSLRLRFGGVKER